MNKTEIKNRLKEIVEKANDTIETLKEKEKWLLDSIQKINDLADHLQEHVEDVFDSEEVENSLKNKFFEDELNDLHDLTSELQDDISSYADDLSESRQERILEKYENLENVLEMYDQNISEYENLEDVVLNINTSIELLKDMY